MKKLSLAVSLAALMAASSAFAADDDNYSNISQVGDDLDATVYQTVTGAGSSNNRSEIIQGADGYADPIGGQADRLSATVNQNQTSGDRNNDNDSEIMQYGDDNSAGVTQGGRNNENDSYIEQRGSNSHASVEQKGNGNENDSHIEQFGDDPDGVRNLARVTQGGNNLSNDSNIAQDGGALTAIVSQN